MTNKATARPWQKDGGFDGEGMWLGKNHGDGFTRVLELVTVDGQTHGEIHDYANAVVDELNEHETLKRKADMFDELVELLEASDNNFSLTTGADQYYKGVKMEKRIKKAKELT